MNVLDPNAELDGKSPAAGATPAAGEDGRTSRQAVLLHNRILSLARPWLPRRFSIAARRFLVSWQLKDALGVWPIMPGTERKPDGWPGWPEGKKFAFVLTHDVEGASGVERCSRLAEIERELGFRSAFNFIPEGAYQTPPQLRATLKAAGFEVGIHDLRHDGRLFESRARFGRSALRINQYLAEWEATGFRSAFMLRQPEWLHQLDIEYDLSTFDTDPFEPQPPGARTIFPFWVPCHSANGSSGKGPGGYIELPSTLPQDSTLFVLLKERTPEIWMRKLDWIAANGGMALVNIHPDHLRFENEEEDFGAYPFSLVREFLNYLKTKYAGQYWNPCPRELARWVRSTIRAPAPRRADRNLGELEPSKESLRGKRAAVVLYSHYPADPRPRRAAEALAGAGMEVDLFCLRDNAGTEPEHETIQGVRVFRLPVRKKRGSKLDYLLLYGSFIWHSFWHLARNGIGGAYDLVHVHNMPDALVFSALVPKLRGAAVILDLHDPMPELMMSIYNLRRNHPLVKVLLLLEKWSIGFSDLAITPNIAFRNLFISRSCPPAKMLIVMNSPEEKIFRRPEGDPQDSIPVVPGEFRLMHHGSIVHRHGVDLLVEAVAQLRNRIPGLRLDIFGAPTPFLDDLMNRAGELHVEDIVHYRGSKTQKEIARAIRECDLGVVPNRFSAFTNLNFPTRLFEYLVIGRPVLAPATRGILDYFGEGDLVTFRPEDVSDLAGKILWVYKHPDRIPALVERGFEVYQAHPWSGEKERFLAGVSQVLRVRSGA